MIVNSNPMPKIAKNTLRSQLLLAATMILLVFAQISEAQTLQDPAFANAMKYVKAKQWSKAETLLKSMLAQNPELHRARLELGLVYRQLNNPELSNAEFATLLAHPAVPERVKQNIRQMLEQNTQGPQTSHVDTSNSHSVDGHGTELARHQFNASLQLSLGYDDNVRYSAADYFLEDDPFLNGVFLEQDDGSFVFVSPDGFVYDEEGNVLFENDGFLDLGNPDRENSFAEARFELNHQYQFTEVSGLSWYNQLSLQATKNQQLSQYNRLQLRIESGLSWRLSEHWKLDIAASHRHLERDGQVQVRALSLAPELTYYTQLGSWTLGMQWMRRKYEDSLFVTGDLETIYEGFDNNINLVSGKWSNLFLDNKLLLLAKFEYSDSNASDDFDYKGQRFTLAGVFKFNESWDLLLSADDFHQDYSESVEGPLDDDITTFRTRLTWQMKDSLSLFLAGERAIRTSDIYGGLKSDKSLLQLGVEWRF